MCDIGVFAYLRALFFWNSEEFGQVSADSERAFSDKLLGEWSYLLIIFSIRPDNFQKNVFGENGVG
jgi:hypothetical protein